MLIMWKTLFKTQEFSHFNTNFQPQGTETKQLFNITALIPHSFQPCVENYVETVENLNESSLYPMLKDKLTYGLYRRGVN